MELHEAVQRILRAHWRLLVASVVIGLVLAFAMSGGQTRYSASVRVSLGRKSPQVDAEAAAIGSAARGIVTSRTVVANALHEVGLRRNATNVAAHDISVSSLGSSNLVEVTVQDSNAQAAADLANALSKQLTRKYLEITQGQATSVLRDIQTQIAGLNQKITAVDGQIASIPSNSPGFVTLRSERDDLSNRVTALETQRDSIVAANIASTQASVVAQAAVPAHRDSSGRSQALELGALLGLLIGIGVAALLETLRPTLVGPRLVGDAANAAFLGRFLESPDRVTAATPGLVEVAARVRLAASAAGVSRVTLIPVPPIDLRRLGKQLEESVPSALPARPKVGDASRDSSSEQTGSKANNGGRRVPRPGAELQPTAAASAGPAAPRIEPFAWGNVLEPDAAGIVMIAADRMSVEQLHGLGDIAAITGRPVLGIATYPAPTQTGEIAERIVDAASRAGRRLQELGRRVHKASGVRSKIRWFATRNEP